jgi:respiratory burst oxidase
MQPTYAQIVGTSEVMTGIFMVFLMLIAYVLAARPFRSNTIRLPWPFHRLTGFNAFWYSHHLFILVYALLIIHSLLLFLTHDWAQKTVCLILLPFYRYRQQFGLPQAFSPVSAC